MDLRELAEQVRDSLGAERVTIYAADAGALIGLVQEGMYGYKTIKVAVDASSLAGYAAQQRRLLNVEDVHDAAALAALDPPAKWESRVEAHLAYPTRQMLVAPVCRPMEQLLGVVQVINRVKGGKFPPEAEAVLVSLCSDIAAVLDTLETRARLDETSWGESDREEQRFDEPWLRMVDETLAIARRREADAAKVVAALRERLAQCFSRDAHPADAEAREELLRAHRRRGRLLSLHRWQRWTAEQLADLTWICKLADSGHMGAVSLRDRLLWFDPRTPHYRYPDVAPADPADPAAAPIAAAAVQAPLLAAALAHLELRRGTLHALHWLDLAGGEFGNMGAHLREAFAEGARPGGPQAAIILEQFPALVGGRNSPAAYSRDSALAEIARQMTEDAERVAKAKLARQERDWVIDCNVDDPASLRSLLDLASSRPVTEKRVFIVIGAAFASGALGTSGAPDLETALAWFSRALKMPLQDGRLVLDGRTCRFIGIQMEHEAKKRAAARPWFERGIELGDGPCFERWLSARAVGEPGVEADLGDALRRLKEFNARFGCLKIKYRNPLDEDKFDLPTGTVLQPGSFRRHADHAIETGKNDLGKLWLELGAEAGQEECRVRLATPAPIAAVKPDRPAQDEVAASGGGPAELQAMAAQVRDTLGAERVTLYGATPDGIVARVQQGLGRFKPIKLPASGSSLAGYVAQQRRLLNIEDVRDPANLATLDPPPKWVSAVDSRAGYVTRQVLAAPVLGPANQLVGVVQVINRVQGGKFPPEAEARLMELCPAIAVALDASGKAEEVEERLRVTRLEEAALDRPWLTLETSETAHRREAAAAPLASALRERVADSFAIDASSEDAAAREEFLQACRDRARLLSLHRWHLWTGDALADLVWTCKLAAAGHIGAVSLRDRLLWLDRALPHQYFQDFAVADPADPAAAAIAQAAAQAPVLAAAMAHLEMKRGRGAFHGCHWLQLAGGEFVKMSAHLREGTAEGAQPNGRFLRIVLGQLPALVGGRRAPQPYSREQVAEEIAREDAARAYEAARGERDREEAEWVRSMPSPADAAALRKLLDLASSRPVTNVRIIVMLGSAFARGAFSPTGEADMENAIAWLARLPTLPRRRGKVVVDGPTCRAIALQAEVNARDVDAALEWYERGIALGDVPCFERWLRARAKAELGLAADLQDARRSLDAFNAGPHGPFRIKAERDYDEEGEADLPWNRALRPIEILKAAVQNMAPETLGQALLWLELGAAMGSTQCETCLAAVRAGPTEDFDATFERLKAALRKVL